MAPDGRHPPRPSFGDVVGQVLRVPNDLNGKPVTPAFRADKQLQEECIELFLKFNTKLMDLEEEIHGFTRAVRPLGSSSGLIFSAIRLPRRMKDIRDVFYANASTLYEAFGETHDSDLPRSFRKYAPEKYDRQNDSRGNFPTLLRGLAGELREFLDSLRDIPEFSDKALPESLEAFASWLDYRANGLQDFGGVAAIKAAQDRAKEQLLNMSTVATFFSGVAATTFQYTTSPQGTTHTLDEVVRALWVSSIILSIASAINSQLAMHWRTAMYRSPRSALPMWTSICLTQTPLLFLVFAVLTFSLGLVIYTCSSAQGKLVTLCATVLTSLTSVILLAVILWEGGERWQAHKSGRDGEEVGPGVPIAHEPWSPYEGLKRWSQILREVGRRGYRALLGSVIGSRDNRVGGGDPFDRHHPSANIGAQTILPLVRASAAIAAQRSLSGTSADSTSGKAATRVHKKAVSISTSTPLRVETKDIPVSQSITEEANISPATYHGKNPDRPLFRAAWRLAVDSKNRDLLKLLPIEDEEDTLLGPWRSVGYHAGSKRSDPIQDLRFSPNGKWIAASFRDGSAGLWKVNRDLELSSDSAVGHGRIEWDAGSLRLLDLAKGDLTFLEVGSSEVEPRKIHIKTDLEAATYFPDNQQVVAIKRNKLYAMGLTIENEPRRQVISHRPLLIHDMASVSRPPAQDPKAPQNEGKPEPTSSEVDPRFVILACSIRDDPLHEETHHEKLLSILGARSQQSRPKDVQRQRRIIVYDVARSQVAAEVPVCAEAQRVSVSRDGRFALVSYNFIAAPELWHIQATSTGAVTLQLCHLYWTPSKPDDNNRVRHFVGRASFGGSSDEYVVASTKGERFIILELLRK
ncbi:hypothetical protein FRB90_008227 [Tulasnella sp. 427]|nr:hypothetical protein FRB90_008227 [Tulasnella sp. 427]